MKVSLVRFNPESREHLASAGSIFVSATQKLKKSQGGVYSDKKMEEWKNWAKGPAGYNFESIREEFEKPVPLKALLAQVDGKFVGIFGYQEGAKTLRKDSPIIEGIEEFARLRFLFVEPGFQKEGVGRVLYERVINDILQDGYRHYYAYVILSAHGFYEKMGAIHLPEHDSYFSDSGKQYPYDTEIIQRIKGICHCKDYTSEDQLPVDFFFIKKNL